MTGRKTRNGYKYPEVSVANTCMELLTFLQETFGGVIVTKKVYQEHHKQSWVWKATYNKALRFLELIRPYMMETEKIRRADLLLSSYRDLTPRNGKYTPDMRSRREALETAFSGAGENRTPVL